MTPTIQISHPNKDHHLWCAEFGGWWDPRKYEAEQDQVLEYLRQYLSRKIRDPEHILACWLVPTGFDIGELVKRIEDVLANMENLSSRELDDDDADLELTSGEMISDRIRGRRGLGARRGSSFLIIAGDLHERTTI
jgi:hypothetical protein